jgi:predicted N-acetyltransferase YhbS
MTTTPDITVRDARPAEADAVRALTMEAYEEYLGLMEPEAWKGLHGAILGAFDTVAAAEMIVAEVEGRLAGSVMLFPARADAYAGAVRPLERPEVRMLAVAPWARGRGIGSILMRECVRRAKESGARELGIHTSRSMRAARELYRRMGFRRIPADDFQPPGGELVEAHALSLDDTPPPSGARATE